MYPRGQEGAIKEPKRRLVNCRDENESAIDQQSWEYGMKHSRGIETAGDRPNFCFQNFDTLLPASAESSASIV
jgi:hypothetical protein